ncbi:hypothetical protein ACGFY9_40775 [Streptomyces sp. NPDC048504]|uniref:hypothetical protein n=1 Tax=Streptomyces sp. NPDC048504 TaxID=3365559 RepID=UPI0037219139
MTRPGFWADFVPWTVNRVDAQALGVWALTLGVGVLGALAEDDLDRTRPVLRALPARRSPQKSYLPSAHRA